MGGVGFGEADVQLAGADVSLQRGGGLSGAGVGLAQQDLDTTVAEDLDLVEAVQRGLQSRGYKPGPLVVDPKGGVNSEHPVMHLQSWMRDAIGE